MADDATVQAIGVRRALRRTVVLPVVVVLAFALVLLWQVQRLVDLTGWVDFTDRVIAEARQVEKLLVDMEAGLRGFLLTGDERFLEPYLEARDRLPQQVGDVARMVEHTPAQRVRIEALLAKAEAWEDFAEWRISQARAGAEMRDVPVALRGKAMMDELRADVAAFIEGEEELRDTRVEDATRSAREVTVGAIAGAILAGLLVAAIVRVQLRWVIRSYEAALASRDRFLELASHELKTPLTPLKTTVQRLRRKLGRTAEGAPEAGVLRKDLEAIERYVDRTTALTRQLLLASGAALPPPVLEPLDLGATVRRIVDEFHAEFERNGIPVALEVGTGVVGNWDRFRVEGIVRQLLGNAVKFGVQRPVEVTVARDGRTASLVVRDYGPGIPADDQERIFERFERAVSERNYGGFGVGLWVSRSFAAQLGGEVRVDSAPQAGARFEVVLPLEPPRAG